MNKKGEVPWYVISLILALGVLLVMVFLFKKHSAAAGMFFSSETLKVKDSKCKFDTERAAIKPIDIDKDGRADICDICVSSTGDSNNDKDNDLDGMPTYCDKDDNDRSITTCRLTVTKDGRCQG